MQTSFGEVAYFSLGVWPPKPENENKKLQEWNSPKQALYVVQWKKTRKWKNETAPNRLCMLSNESLDNYYHLLHHVFSLLCMDILDKLRPPHRMKKTFLRLSWGWQFSEAKSWLPRPRHSLQATCVGWETFDV